MKIFLLVLLVFSFAFLLNFLIHDKGCWGTIYFIMLRFTNTTLFSYTEDCPYASPLWTPLLLLRLSYVQVPGNCYLLYPIMTHLYASHLIILLCGLNPITDDSDIFSQYLSNEYHINIITHSLLFHILVSCSCCLCMSINISQGGLCGMPYLTGLWWPL